MRRESGVRARYEEIAQDLARRIAGGELAEGTRILGRSSLAGTYQVSPETIRRAVAILHERGVVQSVAGSGIRVISRVNAMEFLESFRTRNTLEEGARELRTLLRQRRELDEQIDATLDRLLSQATGALGGRNVEEVTVHPDSWVVGRSLGDIRLRSRTGATAMVVTRGEADYYSPATDMLLEPGDVVTVVGSDAAKVRARDLLDARETPSDL